MPDNVVLSRVTELVQEILAQKSVTRTITPDMRLVDAGLTSMDMVNLMLAVEAAFDILIPPGDITPGNFRSVETIGTMVDRLLHVDAAA